MMPSISPSYIQNILLADDDKDDCLLFKEALEELQISTQLACVYDGEQLIEWLNKNEHLPDILFLDLNMPRKNGLQCLSEIKQNKKWKQLPVIIYSTSFQKDVVDLLYKHGAQFYIRKPNEYSELKNAIHQAITNAAQLNYTQPSKENFLLSHVLL